MKRRVRILLWGVWAGVFAIWLWWYWFPYRSIQVGYVLVTNAGTGHNRMSLPFEAALVTSLVIAFAVFLRPDLLYRSWHGRNHAPWFWAFAGAWPWSVFFASPYMSLLWSHGDGEIKWLFGPAFLAIFPASLIRIVRRRSVRGRILSSCSILAGLIAILFGAAAVLAVPSFASHKSFWGKVDQFYRSFKGDEQMLWPGAVFLAALASRLIIDHIHWTLPAHDGPPQCERCGYDLRGSIPAGATQCPECGEAIPEDLKQKQ